jgi:hypothetical protein
MNLRASNQPVQQAWPSNTISFPEKKGKGIEELQYSWLLSKDKVGDRK